jgi:hypothetical protein
VLTLADVLTHFPPATRVGPGKYRTVCPVHGGRALVITEGETHILFKCWSQDCALDALLSAAGLTRADVGPVVSADEPDYAAVHDYRDAAGVVRYQVVQRRTPPGAKKKFAQRRPGGNGAGAWIWDIKGITHLPFRLPELAGQARVFLCEGEKDVNRLWSLGLPATCNSGGAGKWTAVESSALKAIGVQRVVLLQDFDAPGAAHVKAAAGHLEAAGIQTLTLPPFPGVSPDGGDVSDWLTLGHTRAELEALADGDACGCPVCGLEACDDLAHVPPSRFAGTNPVTDAPAVGSPSSLDPAFLADAIEVIRQGQAIADEGIRFTVDGMIPAYGMLGMLVAFAKVGKTTFGQALAAAVAMGRPFLDRDTTPVRVLILAAEDPPEYTAYLARTLTVDADRLTFYRAPIQLTAAGLAQIVGTVQSGQYGLVLIASWQAVIRGLVKDENDNAGAVNIVETVKAATRLTGIPWLIDAHSGKGEDQDDDADPSKAMRGASGAAGAADYTLSLRYADGTFGTKRRLSGKGRFINFAPLTLDYDATTGAYTCLGSTKTAAADTTWRLIGETGALSTTPQSVKQIAVRIGLAVEGQRMSGAVRRQVQDALHNRPTVGRHDLIVKNNKTTGYAILDPDSGCPTP